VQQHGIRICELMVPSRTIYDFPSTAGNPSYRGIPKYDSTRVRVVALIYGSLFFRASSENACSVSPELFYSFVWLESKLSTQMCHIDIVRTYTLRPTMSPVSNAKRINWINGIWCIIIIASATSRRANYPGRKTRKEVGASSRGRQEIKEMRERRGWSARCNLKSSFVPMKLINRARRLLPPRTFPSPSHPFTTDLRAGVIRDNLPLGVISWKVHFSTVPVFCDVTTSRSICDSSNFMERSLNNFPKVFLFSALLHSISMRDCNINISNKTYNQDVTHAYI